ncbi:MAG: Unknown protein, partial [uncultured Aureispira sp.]
MNRREWAQDKSALINVVNESVECYKALVISDVTQKIDIVDKIPKFVSQPI